MTTKSNLATPAYNSSDWNTPLNSNFTIINDALGNTESVSVALADVTLTATQAQKMRVVVSGTLTGNRILYFPAGCTGFWIVTNATTGNYTVTVKNTSGTLATDVAQGTSALLYSDGTNVSPASNSPTTGSMPPGTVITFAGASAPLGYLSCDGTAVLRSTYANLFAAIGTTWGAGDGSTTFNVPDLRGYFLRGNGTNADGTVGTNVGAKQADAYLNHTHTATQAAHTHTVPLVSSNSFYPGNNGGVVGGGTTTTSSAQPAITVNTSTTGGTETRPKNQGVLYCIKF